MVAHTLNILWKCNDIEVTLLHHSITAFTWCSAYLQSCVPGSLNWIS